MSHPHAFRLVGCGAGLKSGLYNSHVLISYMSDKQNQIHAFWAEIKDALKLNVNYAKFTAAEKLTLLLTTVTFALIGFVLISLFMFFLSIAIVRCIATGTGLIWAYFIMCGFYVFLLCIVIAFRKQLVINPIARFISRLFFNP